MQLDARAEIKPKTTAYTLRLSTEDRQRAEEAADYLDLPFAVFLRGSIRTTADAVLDTRPRASA